MVQKADRTTKNKSKPRGKAFTSETAKKHGQQRGETSRNPKGRPKAKALSEWYRYWMSQTSSIDPERTRADVIADAMTQSAERGELAFARELADRTEGRPRQAVEIAVTERRRLELAIIAMVDRFAIAESEAIELLSATATDEERLMLQSIGGADE
jgi:hypothetical protein